MKTEAFIYIWVEKSTNKYYIGSRSQNGCNPDDGYICSSKIVKPLILKNPDNWTRTILYKSPNVKYIRALESEILKGFDAKTDKYSYNMHNGDGKYFCKGHSEATKKKLSELRKGKTKSLEWKNNIAKSHEGKKHSEETKKKLRNMRTGQKASEETKRKMSESKKVYLKRYLNTLKTAFL